MTFLLCSGALISIEVPPSEDVNYRFKTSCTVVILTATFLAQPESARMTSSQYGESAPYVWIRQVQTVRRKIP